MSYICFLLPSVLFCYMYERRNRRGECHTFQRLTALIFLYLVGVLFINGALISSLIIRNYDGIVVHDLENGSWFVAKYILGATVLAFVLPFLLNLVKKRFDFEKAIFGKNLNVRDADKFKTLIIVLYAVLMGAPHLIRCFNYSFWLDEGATVLAARYSFIGMIKFVVIRGHCPFLYIFENFCWHTFGESGFLFHFAATVPYFFTLIVAVTIVRKWFGNVVSILLITFCSLLECAIIYNLEVRMYAWCQFFILIVFLANYQVYHTNGNIYYILMSLFSIGAVYCHYFALGNVGILYAFLLLYKVFQRKYVDAVKVAASGGSVLLSLLPWFLIAKMIKDSIFFNGGIWIISWRSCFEFIFYSDYSDFLLVCFVVITTLALVFDINIVKIGRNNEDKLRLFFQKPSFKSSIVDKWVWELGGICSVLGTIIFAQVFSALVSPITHLRYLYISFIIIWLIFSINISSIKFHRILALSLVLFIVLTCGPKLCATIAQERDFDQRLNKMLSVTKEIDSNDCIIYTNSMDVFWYLAYVYYPHVQVSAFGNPEFETPDTPEFDDDRRGWLFLSDAITDELQKFLSEHGREARLIDNGVISIDNGVLFGTETVFIYKIYDVKKESI